MEWEEIQRWSGWLSCIHAFISSFLSEHGKWYASSEGVLLVGLFFQSWMLRLQPKHSWESLQEHTEKQA